MIKTRCFKCGFAYQLTEQTIANMLVVQGITQKPQYFMSECPRCRQTNKVSLRRVTLPEPEAPGEEGSTAKD
jgi:phage FluMu protein Com